MSEEPLIRSLFDDDIGEIRVQGTMSKASSSELRRLMPNAEEIIERETFGKLLNKDKAEKENRKSSDSNAKKKNAGAPKFEMSGLERTNVDHGWVPPGEYVEVAGRKIPGMVYIFDSHSMNKAEIKKHAGSRFWIDVSKPASGRDKMGLYLNASKYSEMEPANCASYLDWHANGKFERDFHPYYRLLYFYGLEHRYLCDGISNEEAKQIRDELLRLREVYEDDKHLRSCISKLLEFGEFQTSIGDIQVLDKFFDIPLNLQIELSEAISKEDYLNSEQVYNWFCNSERSSDYDSDFLFPNKYKFLEKFDKTYPKGMKVKPTANVLFKEYSSASGEFQLSETVKVNGRSIMDIGRLNAPMDRAEAIFISISKESAKPEYNQSEAEASDSGQEIDNKKNEEESKPKYSSKDKKFIKWAKELAAGRIPCTWEELLDKLEERLVDESYTLQHKIFEDLINLGFDLAPAGMYATSARNMSDPVILFKTDGEYAKDRNGEYYIDNLLNLLGLGSYLYSLAGLDSKDTSKNLLSLIANMEALSKKCNESDLTALRANFEYLLLVPTNDKFVKLLVKESSPSVLDMYRSFVVEAASKLDISQAKAISSVEKIYKMFKLDPKLAYSDLHAGAYVPTAVKNSAKGGASDILDVELIESIRTDTEKVSSVLGTIFTGEDKHEADSANGSLKEGSSKVKGETETACESKANGTAKPSAKEKTNGKSATDAQTNGKELPDSSGKLKTGISFPGLDEKHAGFMSDLVQQSFWSEKAFSKLAEKHGLMPGGVTETINEWVYERYNDVLLDEHEGFHVAAAIAETMKSETERN